MHQYFDFAMLAGIVAFLMVYFDVRYLFYDTVVTGGDTASWQGVAEHLARVLIPAGRLTGWDMGNFAGYPNFNFYFLPPFLLGVIPSILFDIPLTITLKWAIMSGIFLLPPAVYFGLRNMDYRFPVPIMGAAGSLLLLFNESYTMFGANTLSTFAGEFCYMFAFALFVYFVGSFYRGYKTGTRGLRNGILLGVIGLSHLFVFIPALMVLLYAFFDKGKVRYLLRVAGSAFACMAFWILPLVAFRHPYTTPVYMIWQEFVNLRYTMAGLFVGVVCVIPRLALAVIAEESKLSDARRWGFASVCAAGTFAGAYLAGQYLVLGGDLWATGLKVPAFSTSPIGPELAGRLSTWVLPAAVFMGLLALTMGGRKQSKASNTFMVFGRTAGTIAFLFPVLFLVLSLHTFVAKALPDSSYQLFFLKGRTMAAFYAPVFLALGFFLLSSRRVAKRIQQAARHTRNTTPRFFLWLALCLGSVVAYFSAHFLQIPDIRFLPPLVYGLFFILFSETLGVFLAQRGPAVKIASAITTGYLVLIMVIFGASKSEPWYRSNNRGYEMSYGYRDFSRVNQYLKTVYESSGLDPLNAPRVGYEKCDLYGPYGGDRVFESIPYFSGRQTLEGIHFAASMAAHSMAYLQTEFSRDIKTPKPQIFSKLDVASLPAHFDLYNLSQLVVMTRTAKKALSYSPWFEKEAVFGNITLYRYTRCDRRYVDVPKVRPVLYAGKNWADAFYAWFRDPKRLDTLLVPERFVKDRDDQSVFNGKIDSLAGLENLREKPLDRRGLEIDTHLEHLKIRFTTNRVGMPHLIKVSYFPNWRVRGAEKVYPVSPHLMMVIPRQNEVVLTYERSGWEISGLVITGGWILFVLIKGVQRLLGARSVQNKPRTGVEAVSRIDRAWESLERSAVRIRPWAFGLVLTAAVLLVGAGAVLRNRPVRIYEAGYHAYIKGTRVAGEGRYPDAKRYFLESIRIMAPLLTARSRYDHRDVINSLLTTAMCYEQLKDFDAAESWYRTLINEYSRSRYVAEAYVKLARIYRQRMNPIWQEGLDKLHRGEKASGIQMLKSGLAIMEKSLTQYRLAIRKDPNSVWTGYGLKDLENEARYLEGIKKSLKKIAGPDVMQRVKRLGEELEKIKEGGEKQGKGREAGKG